MASQVDSLLSTPEGLEKALRTFQEIGITKIYLESLRCGYKSNLEILQQARDFFQKNNIEVSGGITLDTIGQYSATGVDQISVGRMTNSAAVLDIGLDIGDDVSM